MADTTKQLTDQSFFVFVKDTNTGRIRRMAIPGDVQIGLQGNPAELQLLGRLSLAATDYSITAANQGILYVANDDTIISVSLVDTPSSGRITLFLPANPRNGQLHFVKDMTGTADSVPIDVVPSPGAKIDQFDSRTLTDKFGSIALYWFGDRWRILVSGLGLAGIGGAPDSAAYITLAGNSFLSAERCLNLSGTNLTLVDQGPNASVILDLTTLIGAPGTFTYATVTVDAKGRITAISNGAAPPPGNASYITVANEPGLSDERAFAAGTGILVVDGGANGLFTVGVNNSVVATLTGSIFTGPLSGSIQRTSAGVSYLVAGPGITILTQSNGQIVIGSPWTDGGNRLFTTSSVSVDGQGRFAETIGSDVYFFVSGTIGVPSGGINQRRVAAFGGDVRISGSLTVGTGSVRVTGNDVQFGGNDTRIERQGADLKFFDVTNPQGHTLSSLIGGGGGSSTAGTVAPFIITGSGWQTVYDRDFALESAYTASADGLQTIAGLPVRIANFNNAEFIGIVPGEGLIIDPNANNSDYYLTVHTSPTLYVTMSSMISDFNFSDYEVRLWLQFYNQNDDANFEFVRWGFERANWSSNQNYAALWQKGFASSSNFHGAAFWSGSVEYIVADVPVSNNIGCIHLLDDRNADYYSTSRSLGDMPGTPAGTTFAGSVRGVGQHGLSTNNLTLAPIWNTGSNVVITITSQPVNTNNSLRTVIRRMRLEALKKTVNVTSGNVILDAPVAVTTVQTVSYTGTTASFTVPDGVTELDVKMWGGGGGNGAWPSNNTAGAGGYASGKISVTPGEELFIIVAGGGQGTTGSSGDGGRGGWGGGGFGTKGDASGGGGGGYTGIFSGAIHQQTAIMIAGGGGGGTGFRTGGGGGGTSGGSVDNGTGGTQTAAGGPSAGGPLYGGKGTGQRTVSTSDDDGGGGGGYFGGGGGSGDGRGGGGGSGFLHPTRVTDGTLTAGENGNTSNTRANPPNTTDSDYLSLAPTNTGKGGNTVGGNGTDGGHGFIVIRYTVGSQQAYWLEDDANTAYITSSVAIGTTGSAQANAGQEAFFYVSGTIGASGSQAKKSIFGGDVVVSGALYQNANILPPPSASWTTTNISPSSALFIDQNGHLFLSGNVGVTTNHRIAHRSAPGTPYRVTAKIRTLHGFGSSGTSFAAMAFRESGSGRLVAFGLYFNSSTGLMRMAVLKYDSPTSFNSSYADNPIPSMSELWLRLEDDGTNRICSYSTNGINFAIAHTVSRTDFLTADQVGITVESNSVVAGMTVESWKVE
jgi:hypothetical protein